MNHTPQDCQITPHLRLVGTGDPDPGSMLGRAALRIPDPQFPTKTPTTAASRLDCDRWCDIDGRHLVLFCEVEQVHELPEPGVLASRLGQQGEVVGRGLESLFVRFSDHAVVGLPPQVLRLIPDTAPGKC